MWYIKLTKWRIKVVIILIDAEKAYDRIQHLLMIKMLNKQKECTAAAAAAKSLQSCLTLSDPMDCSPPGSPIPGILQARTLEWVAISFSSAWKWKVKVKSLSRVRLLATPWTAAHQAPPPINFPGKSTGVGCHSLLRLTELAPSFNHFVNHMKWACHVAFLCSPIDEH